MNTENEISQFMNMVDMATEKAYEHAREIAECKKHAKADVARAMAKGQLSILPKPRPMAYEKKTDIKREAAKFSIAEIKTKLAVIEEMRAEGMTILEACSLAGISQGNLHRWQKKLEAEQ
jgi:DNA invertase Pin-like site-specific DNA recombinase